MGKSIVFLLKKKKLVKLPTEKENVCNLFPLLEKKNVVAMIVVILNSKLKYNCPFSPNLFCRELFWNNATIVAQHRYTQSLP